MSDAGRDPLNIENMSKYKKEVKRIEGQDVAVYTRKDIPGKCLYIAPANAIERMGVSAEEYLDKKFGEVGERIKPLHC